MNSHSMSRSWGLDLVRAIAILSVLLSHGRSLLPDFAGKRFMSIGGFLGVELFFVLSGYLIGRILITVVSEPDFRVASLTRFLSRRWLRTLPLYVVFLCINVALSPQLFQWKYLLFLQNLATPCPSFMPESWSLAVEEWFYIIAPIGIGSLLLARVRPAIAIAVSLAFILALPLAGRLIVFGADPFVSWDAGIRKIVFLRLDAIAYGFCFAYIKRRFGDVFDKILLVSGVVVFAFSLGKHSQAVATGTFDGFDRTLFFSITSLGFAMMLPYVGRLRPSFGLLSQAVELISKWSYSAYLAHLPLVIPIMRLILPHLGPGITYALFLSVTFGFAAISYTLIELPILRFRDQVFPERIRKSSQKERGLLELETAK
jgi:peptidoglycan/LPS O-acetylase OafA/YrhL